MGDHVNRSKVQVCFLPLGVGPHDVQDMKAVFEISLALCLNLKSTRVVSGRCRCQLPVVLWLLM